MCGIVGIVSKCSVSEENLNEMNDKLIHRGPDGGGIYIEEKFGFGHRRLAIIDLSNAGHQPMHYLDRYVITYNGEIYNHLELRAELEQIGYTFNSNSDTEVIMAAYDYWGADCFNRFNGMWAFCIHDRVNNDFVMSRDRFGIKPLYYRYDGKSFAFASEVKALFADADFKGVKPNISNLRSYLENGSNEQSRETSFEGIYRFDFNSYVVASSEDLIEGRLTFKTYWKLKPNNSRSIFRKNKLEKFKQGYLKLLRDSVDLRLRADVKVGSALSGGIDSSSIVALVNQSRQEAANFFGQETFSSVYKSEGTNSCDESAYIDELSEYLSVKSNQIEPKISAIPSEHRKMIYHLEHPPSGTLMSGWHTFKLVKRTDVTVTLDGQGADEQLAGYDGYVTNYVANAPVLEAVSELLHVKNKSLHSRIQKGIIFNICRRVIGERVSKLLLGKIISNLNRQLLPLNEKLEQDLKNNLVTLLHYSDRVSMAHSIESRMPFLDYRLVEYLASIPAAYKYRKGWSKYIARVAMDGVLPQNILWRKDKMGWPIPEQYWFEGEHKQWLDDTVLHSPFLKKYFESYLDNYRSLRLQEKLRMLNLAVWSEVFCVK